VYSLPRGVSLINNEIAQLVHGIGPISAQGPKSCQNCFVLARTTDDLLPIIMSADGSWKALRQSDARAILLDTVSRYGHAAFQQPQVHSFMRIASPQTRPTPSEVRERLLRLQQDSPHFGSAHSDDAPLRTPIVGNAGSRSLALLYLHAWFETPR
jgi:hypothetical protein